MNNLLIASLFTFTLGFLKLFYFDVGRDCLAYTDAQVRQGFIEFSPKYATENSVKFIINTKS